MEHVDNELINAEDLSSSQVEELENKPKGFITNVMCPDCGKHMVVRENRKDNSKFLGCSCYPNCKGTLSFTTRSLSLSGMENLAYIGRIINNDWFGSTGRNNCEEFGLDYESDNYWGTESQIHCHDDM